MGEDPFSSLSPFGNSNAKKNTPIGQMSMGSMQQPKPPAAMASQAAKGMASQKQPLRTDSSSSINASGLDFLAKAGTGTAFIPVSGANPISHSTSRDFKPQAMYSTISPSRANGMGAANLMQPERNIQSMNNGAYFMNPLEGGGGGGGSADDLLGLGTGPPAKVVQPNSQSGSLLDLGDDSLAFPANGNSGTAKSIISEKAPTEDDLLGILSLPVEEAKKHVAKSEEPLFVEEPVNCTEDDVSPEVQKVMEMGFCRDSAVEALESCGYNVEAAVAMLLNTESQSSDSMQLKSNIRRSLSPQQRGRRVSFGSVNSEDLSAFKSPSGSSSSMNRDKLVNAATSFGQSVFSTAKTAFSFGKQKITSLSASYSGNADSEKKSRRTSFSKKPRYQDDDSDSSGDDADYSWYSVGFP